MDDVPDCPECGTDAFTNTIHTGEYHDYRCWFCNIFWCQSRAGNEWGVPSDIQDAPQTGKI